MDFNKLSAAEKRIVLLAAGVILGGLAGVADGWGIGATVALFAGFGIAFIVLQPQLAPTLKLPGPKGLTLQILAVIAAVGMLLSALTFLSSVFDFTNISTILFDIGLISSFILAYLMWLDYKTENPEAAARLTSALKPAATEPGAAAAAAAPAPAPAPARVAARAPEPVATPEPVAVAAEPMAEAAEPEAVAEAPEPEAFADAPEDAVVPPEGTEDQPKAG